MNDAERDAILIRVDERTKLMDERLGRIQEHQEKQNGAITVALNMCHSHTTAIKIISGVGGALILLLATALAMHLA